MQQELLSCPVHLSSLPVFSEVRVARCLGFSVMFCGSLLDLLFVDHCLTFCPFLLAIVLSALRCFLFKLFGIPVPKTFQSFDVWRTS